MQMRVCAFFADVREHFCKLDGKIRLLRWTFSCFVGNPLVWSVIICSVIDRNQISRHNRLTAALPPIIICEEKRLTQREGKTAVSAMTQRFLNQSYY